MSDNKKIIQAKHSFLNISLKDMWQYRELLLIFVKRDYLASYKQTILGPLWHIIQPIFPTIMFTFVFGKVAKISTDGLPQPLFYLSGLVLWNYFSDCLSRTSNVLVSNAGIFGKVYFPRLITPLSFVISSLMRLFSQFILFLMMLLYYKIFHPNTINFNFTILYFPLLIILLAGYSLGAGLIVSSLSSKYRDLGVIISFFIGLLQYATCVIYPVSAVPNHYRFIVKANPLTPIIETFRYGFLGNGDYSLINLMYSFCLMLIVLFIGVLSFNKIEKTFMDTV